MIGKEGALWKVRCYYTMRRQTLAPVALSGNEIDDAEIYCDGRRGLDDVYPWHTNSDDRMYFIFVFAAAAAESVSLNTQCI